MAANCAGTQDKMSKPRGVISQIGQRVAELLITPKWHFPTELTERKCGATLRDWF